MTNPFLIDTPAAVSFSGGRTSALMLRRILDAFGGTLPEDVHVLFCNTGKERGETLRFVQDVSERWGVQIHWLEYARHYEPAAMTGAYRKHSVSVEVDFKTASRHGEPFEEAIRARSYLPNPVTRFCTVELKIRTMHRWMRSRGYTEWTQAVGLRADESDRVKSLLGGSFTPAESPVCPLFDAGITKRDVMDFWGGAAVRPPAPALGRKLRPVFPEGPRQAPPSDGRPTRARVLVDRARARDGRIVSSARTNLRTASAASAEATAPSAGGRSRPHGLRELRMHGLAQ